MGILRRLAGKAEGAVNKHVESTFLGGDPTEVGELRAMATLPKSKAQEEPPWT